MISGIPIGEIVAVVLAILSVVLGGKIQKAHRKFKELTELLVAVNDCWEEYESSKKVTQQKFEKVMQEANDLIRDC